MNHIEELLRQQEEEEAKKPGKPKAVEGPTSAEILRDSEKSRLFLAWLDGIGGEDLAAKLATPGEIMEESDNEVLARAREDFLSLWNEAETVAEKMDDGMIDKVIAASPRMKSIVGNYEKSAIRDALLKGIREGVFINPDYLAELKKKVADYGKDEAAAGEANEKLEALLAKYNISPETYHEAFKSGDLKAIDKIIDKSGGFFEKYFGKEDKFYDKFDIAVGKNDIKRAMEALKKRKAEIGEAMYGMLANDDVAKKVLSESLRNEKVETPKEDGLSFAEAGRVGKEFIGRLDKAKENAIKDREAYGKRHKDAGWSKDEMDRNFAEEFFDRGVANEADKKKWKKGGAWGRIFRAIFIGRIEKMVK